MLQSVSGKAQIISLGAGSDTRAFNIFSKYGSNKVVFHEIDFSVTTTKKIQTIVSTPKISQLIWESQNVPTELSDEIHTRHYHLHARDLRTIQATSPLLEGMDTSLPTLVISECCLCYLQPEESDAVLHWLSSNFQNNLSITVYEPIGGNDSFGQVMIENLASRGISLPTLKQFPTLESQVNRLDQKGFTDSSHKFAAAADIWYIFESWIPDSEKERISKLEVLDEIEELSLLLKHYCISWAVKTTNAEWVSCLEKFPNQVKSA